MEGNGRWMMSESAERERIDIAQDLGRIKTVKIKTLEKLKLLDENGKDQNTILYFTAKERANLQDYINLLLINQRRIDKKNKRWNQRHIKACSNPECQTIVGRDDEKCPRCGLDTKWYKTDEKGNPTDVETEKTPPPADVQEAFPILHSDASEIVDTAQSRAKKKLIDRATAKGYEYMSGLDDLREGD